MKTKTTISPNFTVDDIHNLRVQIGEQYRSMSKEEVEQDIAFHVKKAQETMDNIKKGYKTEK